MLCSDVAPVDIPDGGGRRLYRDLQQTSWRFSCHVLMDKGSNSNMTPRVAGPGVHMERYYARNSSYISVIRFSLTLPVI